MAAFNPLHRTTLLLLLSILAARASSKPQDDDHHVSVWGPKFPFSQYSTRSSNERPRHASATTSAHSKIALHYEPNIFTLGLSGGYYGEVSFGTPPQTLTVLFGSESRDAWIANFPCGSKHKFYNHSKSSSYIANGTTFGGPDSFASGFYSEDTMQFGNFAIHHQLFAEVNNVDNFPEYPRTALDGVIGLGRDTAAFDPFQLIKTPFHQLVDSGVLDKPVFAFYLNKGVGGELTLGAIDETHYTGEITYVPLDSTYDWRIPINTIRVNGKHVTKLHMALVDPIVPVIWGPTDEVEALAEIIGADVDNKYEIDCSSSGPEIVIVIGGTKFALTKKDYTLRTEGSTVCHWAINPMPEQTDAWILGIPFVEKFYTIFDWGTGTEGTDGRVGLALRA